MENRGDETFWNNQKLSLNWLANEAIQTNCCPIWSARCIIDKPYKQGGFHRLDVVSNRTVYWGPNISIDEENQFFRWINEVGLRAIREGLKMGCEKLIDPRSKDCTEVAEDGYKMIATPNASHGYLYIAAWKTKE